VLAVGSRSGELCAQGAHLLGIRVKRLLNPRSNLVARLAECDDAAKVGEAGAPSAVIGLFEDDYVFAHRRCSKPLAQRMLESVPTGTMLSPSFAATKIRASLPGRAQTACYRR
jgi:hypothetical protein